MAVWGRNDWYFQWGFSVGCNEKVTFSSAMKEWWNDTVTIWERGMRKFNKKEHDQTPTLTVT